VKTPTRKTTQINNCSAKHMCDKSSPNTDLTHADFLLNHGSAAELSK